MKAFRAPLFRSFGITPVDLAVAVLIAALGFFLLREGWPKEALAVAIREADGKGARLKDFIAAGLWWGWLFSFGILLLLALTRPLWTQRMEPGALPISGNLGKQFWLILLSIAVFGGFLRFQRLDTSLYADETYTLQNYVHGMVDIRKPEPRTFEERGWEHTFFGNKEANNHVLFSIAARASQDLWRQLSGAAATSFNETALRFPSWVAGVASILLLGIILARGRMERTAIAASFLLALHPWHIRYSGEARGYAFVMFFILLGAFFIQSAFRNGGWRAWAGFAVAQFGALASFPGAIYLVVASTISIYAVLLFSRDVPGPRVALLSRMTAANLMAAIPFVLLYAPSAPQIVRYLGLDRAQGSLGAKWFLDEWSLFAVGMPAQSENPANPLLVGAFDALPAPFAWVGGAFTFGLMPLILILGLVALCRKGGVAIPLAIGSAAGVALGIAHSLVGNSYLFPWYLIFALPGFIAACAHGLQLCGVFAARISRTAAMERIVVSLLLILFLVVTQRPRAVASGFSREQNREVARALRGGAEPGSPEAAKTLAAIVWSNSPVYDPEIRWAPQPRELVPLMKESVTTGKPLYYGYAHRNRAETSVPQTMKLLNERRLFDFVSTHPGTDEMQFTHYVLRLRDGLSVEEIDKIIAEIGVDPAFGD